MIRHIGLHILTAPLLIIFSCLFLGPTAHAQMEGTGVGVSFGVTNGTSTFDPNPVGLNGKYWLSDRQALAGMTSFYIGGTDDASLGPSYWVLQGDYLFHNFNELTVSEGFLAPYVGAGMQFTVFEDVSNQWALRGPTGITYLFEAAPLDLYLEVAPTLSLTDPSALRFDGAIGFRYYFSSSGE